MTAESAPDMYPITPGMPFLFQAMELSNRIFEQVEAYCLLQSLLTNASLRSAEEVDAKAVAKEVVATDAPGYRTFENSQEIAAVLAKIEKNHQEIVESMIHPSARRR